MPPLTALVLAITSAAAAAAPSPPAQPEALLLAVEVRAEGDAGAWRWWCSSAPDPLLSDVLSGMAQGFAERAGIPVVASLDPDTSAVHPMYCEGTLDPDLAMNLAGLLGARGARTGRLVVGAAVEHAEPALLSAALALYPPEARAGEPAPPAGSEPGSPPAMPPPEAARRAVALDHDGLRAAQREAAAGLGRDVAAGLLRARVRAPMGRTLWIEVRGPKTDDDDRLVARSVQALLPRGMRVRPAGLRGERSLLHVEAPVGYEGELLALLQERVADPGGGPPPLLFEGFSPDGSPRFAAVQLDVSEEE